MKFVRFRADCVIRIGVMLSDTNQIIDLSDFMSSKSYNTMNDLIQNMDESDLCLIKSYTQKENLSVLSSWAIDKVEILSPIEKPIHDIICVGVNYKDHLDECYTSMNVAPSEKAVYFSKRCSAILGDNAEVEGHLEMDDCLDYEVELAVIIGKKCRNISPVDVEDYIFGYSVFNDISARTLQKQHNQWFIGKSLDGFCAMGPCIVHKSEMVFPIELDITSKVNGELRQESNTKHLIRDIGEIISELSTGITLEAGDIIITGTPAGVGMGFTPPKYLKSGDVVECGIKYIGSFKNKIR